MITEAIRLAMGTAGPTRWVRFRPADGPRNQPARDWLGRFLGPSPEADAEGWVTMAWDDAAGAGRVAEAPVTVSRRVSA
jgi:hypothetical protein